MNKAKKYYLLFWIIILSMEILSQDRLSIQYQYANTLFKTGQYFDAITEYKRLQFFDSTNTYQFISNFQIGECYKAGAKLDEAIKYFSLAEINTDSVENKYKSKIGIIRANILRRTTDRAHQIINEMEKTHSSKVIQDSLNYWRGWTFIFEDNWKEASESFAKINSFNELKILCDRVEKEKVSITFATVISYILPGAGQIYTGNVFSGIMSLGWNILSGYFTINAFQSQRAFDGLALLTLLWQRFYRGNVQNSENFAVKKNIDIANKALNYLQNEYKGPKP
jgi:tetratricopeptide (TPR) repeat protein